MNIIKRIEITSLFHKFNVEWDLHPDVNILIGINGSGKSTILRSINALLSKNYLYLKNLKIAIEITLSENTVLSCSGLSGTVKNEQIQLNHEYITTFDVPLKDKKTIKQTETPLDKELQKVIYVVGQNQKSFSNYRLKAMNYPELTKSINERIEELFDIINRLFAETEKKIEINREDNSLFFRRDQSVIPLEKLSSGEKQLLIIVFTIFLMDNEPCIVLMDEPELSLHVSWQQQLIDIIRKLNPNCQIIIATHSPSIFGEGWGDKLFFVEDLVQ
ncbi:MAG: AAA family ATPase [Dysgonamonadaceae bacterium]|nr:AAA family ATPase [Dysgonamonadaceae bacterium]